MIGCSLINRTQAFGQAGLVDHADLVQHDLSGLSAKADRDAGGIGTPFGERRVLARSGRAGENRCHGSHDDCVDMPVHFIKGDNQTGPGLSDFVTFGRIEAYEIVLESVDYHCHSSWSHREVEAPAWSRGSQAGGDVIESGSPGQLRRAVRAVG